MSLNVIPEEKTQTTLLIRKDLDHDPYLENILIDEEQNHILAHTILWTLLLSIIFLFAW